MVVATAVALSCAHSVDTIGDDDDDGASSSSSGTGGTSGSCEDQGLADCGGECVDVTTNAAHCGGCNQPCDSGVSCSGGQCSGQCPSGYIECEPGTCTDILIDASHCGACGNPCLSTQACVSAICTCPGTQTECADSCVDTLTNDDHCGGCDSPCTNYDSCSGGTCQLDCAGNGLTECGTTCVDTMTDNANCGSCYNTCGSGKTCTNGLCECPGGMCGTCNLTDIGSTVPQVQVGTTTGSSNDTDPQSCAYSGGIEVAFKFTAPSAGSYTFDTQGSSFDTVLYAYDTPACTEIACDDDTYSLQSEIVLNLTANAVVVVVVDGYDSYEYGSFTLNVN